VRDQVAPKRYERSLDRFAQEINVQADIINIAANFYLRLAEQELPRRRLSPIVK
jgi:hypothetical protein